MSDPHIPKILTFTTELTWKAGTHTRGLARPNVCGLEVSTRRWSISSPSSTPKVEELRALQAWGQMQCWTLLMRAIKNRTHYYFCSTVEVWCEEFLPPPSQGRTRSGKEHMVNRVGWSLVIQLVHWEVAWKERKCERVPVPQKSTSTRANRIELEPR